MVVGYQTLKKGVSWSDNYGLVDFKIEEFSVWSVCLVKLKYYGFKNISHFPFLNPLATIEIVLIKGSDSLFT